MQYLKYKFDNLTKNISKDYYFQTVKNRKLSNVYHSHDYFEFIVIIEGCCTQIVNENKVVCNKNHLTVLTPEDRHKIINQSSDVNVLALSVSKEETQLFEQIFGIAKTPLKCATLPLSSKQMLPFINLYLSKSEAEFKLLLSNFIKVYIDSLKDETGLPQSVENAIKKMQKRENMKEGIDRFVSLSGYSKTQLSRIVKKHLGVTLHEFILNLRLNEAHNALMLSDINAEDLSISIGYESFSYFQKIFKEKYGITPSSVRKKYRSDTI